MSTGDVHKTLPGPSHIFLVSALRPQSSFGFQNLCKPDQCLPQQSHVHPFGVAKIFHAGCPSNTDRSLLYEVPIEQDVSTCISNFSFQTKVRLPMRLFSHSEDPYLKQLPLAPKVLHNLWIQLFVLFISFIKKRLIVLQPPWQFPGEIALLDDLFRAVAKHDNIEMLQLI
jgi:hypothetical protein